MLSNTNKEEIHFIPDGNTECDYCGVTAFEHIHKPNTVPKDFIIVEKQDVPSPNPLIEHCGEPLCPECNLKAYNQGNKDTCLRCGQIKTGTHTCKLAESHKAEREIIKLEAYNEGLEDGKREMVEKIKYEIDKYWRFDENQCQLSSWHEKQDLLEVIDTLSNQVGKNI